MNQTTWENINNTPEYLEWKDFNVEIEYRWNNTFFYFRTPEWHLVWYSKIYEPREDELCRWTIVDAISAYKLSTNLSPKMQELFSKNWYNWTELKDFWSTIYSYILQYLQDKYWSRILINVASNDNDAARNRIMNCLSKTQERTLWIIKRVRWGDDGDAAVIYLSNPEKK